MNAARNLASHLLAQAQALDPGCHNVLYPAAQQAGHIEWLYWFIFWILLAVFVLMIAALTGAEAKAWVVASPPLPVIEHYEAGERRAGWAVSVAIGITVITLFVILVVSVITGKRVEGLTSKNPVSIQITGDQWWWEVPYPNSQAARRCNERGRFYRP